VAEYHVSKISGAAGNPGSEAAPFNNITDAVTAAGSGDTVYIHDGTYTDAHDKNYASGVRWVGLGKIIFDGTGFSNAFVSPATGKTGLVFENIIFRDAHILYQPSGVCGTISFKNCRFEATGANHGVLNFNHTTIYGAKPNMEGCTMFGFTFKGNTGVITGSATVKNNILDVDDWYTKGTVTYDYNVTTAVASAARGTHGADIASLVPPWKDSDPSAPDLDFDLLDTNYDACRTGGEHGECIGSSGRPVYGWDDILTNNKPGDASSKLGPWTNNDDFYNDSFVGITISLGVNDKLNFKESVGGAELTATLTPGTYASGAALAAQAQTDVNATVGIGDSHVVTFSTAGRIVWGSDGSELILLCNTGTDAATSAYSTLGFDTSADKSGLTSYAGDNNLLEGAQPGAETGATSARFTSGVIDIDTDTEPTGVVCEIDSPVIAFRRYQTIKRVTFTKYLTGDGEADYSQASATRTFLLRANLGSFSAGDPAGTTDLDWTEVTQNTELNAGSGYGPYTHAQLRVRLRSNKTS